VSRDASVAVPGTPAVAPASAVLGEIGQAALEAVRKGAALLVRVVPAATGVAAAAPILLLPGNSGAELHPMGENLRVRTAPGQRSATVQRRVDDGLFGTGIGAKWVDLPVRAEWASDDLGRRYIAIDRRELENAIGRDATDATLGDNSIAMAKPPMNDEGGERREPGPGHNSEPFGEAPPPGPPEPPESGDGDPRSPRNPTPLVLAAIDSPGRVQSRINLIDVNPVDRSGWQHAVSGHFDPTRTGKSRFSISPAELRELLQTREVIRSPIVRVLRSVGGPRYVREVTLNGRNIGIDANTNSPTSILTVLTDKYGNLVTAFPGRM
jgi:hypothetical protein